LQIAFDGHDRGSCAQIVHGHLTAGNARGGGIVR
jgi:hypothetical protein